MSIVEQVARMIEPGAYMDGWVDERGRPVSDNEYLASRVAYRRAKAESLAVKILALALTENELRSELIEFEIAGWKKAGFPADSFEIREIVDRKYGVVDKAYRDAANVSPTTPPTKTDTK